MSDTYWVRHQGRSLGPYTLDKIRQMIRKGQVGRAQEMSLDGESWAPATTFPEVFQHAITATVIQQPAAAPMTSLAPLQSGPTLPAVATEWYHACGGQQQGPVSLPGLLGMIRAGQLSASDLVYREGLDNWTAAGDVPELASGFAPQVVRPEPVAQGRDAFCRECGSPVSKKAVMCPKCGAPTQANEYPAPDPFANMAMPEFGQGTRGQRQRRGGDPKSKTVAALLALLLGGIGAHHFYLGNTVLGIIYLVCCWTLIPGLLAFVEAIVFLTMSDAAFDAKYN